MGIKIFHEAPKSIFNVIAEHTDGDYALCNLLEADEDYVDLFKKAKAAGREIILDNAAFELGYALENEILMEWVEILEPDWVILPDVLDEAFRTINAASIFLDKYSAMLPSNTKTVGVVQGGSYQQAKYCYESLEPLVDMIAFPFQPKRNIDIGADSILQAKLHSLERVYFLNRLEQEGVINTTKPHHLLGCTLPTEFRAQNRPWIYSLDTSNPVMWGIKYGEYPPGGPKIKPEGKLFEHIDIDVTKQEADNVLKNIKTFREWVNGVDKTP